jgi:hypothetical protein
MVRQAQVVAAILKEVMTNEASVLLDTDAANKAADADMALAGAWAPTMPAWPMSPRRSRCGTPIPASPTRSCGWSRRSSRAATSPAWRDVNAVDAWLGSLPGHVLRQCPAAADLDAQSRPHDPAVGVWAGPERDEHSVRPCLLYGKTEGSTPFRFSLHVGDVGHTLIVGPTGAGKSVLLALMALQFRRYPERRQVFAFDFGGSIRAAALAMGGDWHDLGGGLTDGAAETVALQPLARIDDVL